MFFDKSWTSTNHLFRYHNPVSKESINPKHLNEVGDTNCKYLDEIDWEPDVVQVPGIALIKITGSSDIITSSAMEWH